MFPYLFTLASPSHTDLLVSVFSQDQQPGFSSMSNRSKELKAKTLIFSFTEGDTFLTGYKAWSPYSNIYRDFHPNIVTLQ